MISQANRFHGYNALNFVYRQGRTVRSPLCALKYAVNLRQPTCRIAVVVSKKVHKSAVVRNRIRRRVYEQFRQLVLSINSRSHQRQQSQVSLTTSSYDIVFTAFNDQLAKMPEKELNAIIKHLLQISRIA